jgi:DNA-binding response OmpR family regulator
MKPKILLVEDDVTLGEGLKKSLSKNYEVEWASRFSDAKMALAQKHFDLLILDLGLPDGYGMDLVPLIPDRKKTALLFLTAQNDPETRLKGYELGAEEFIPKPFHLKELMLRLEHIFSNHVPVQEIHVGDIRINLETFSIHSKDGRIEYPPVKDMKILKLLIEKSPQPVSRDEIINEVWGSDSETSHRTIDNAMARIRQLIGDIQEKYIRSVRGVGYQWIGEET